MGTMARRDMDIIWRDYCPKGSIRQKRGFLSHPLYLPWEVQPSSWIQGLIHLGFRPTTWDGFVEESLSMREQIVSCFQDISSGVNRYLKRSEPTDILSDYSIQAHWASCFLAVGESISLPLCVADPWGFVYEGQGQGQNSSTRPDVMWGAGYYPLTMTRYRSYLKLVRDYTMGISSFLRQAPDIVKSNGIVGKLQDHEQRASLLAELGLAERYDRLVYLSVYNLQEALDALSDYQQEFRRLFGTLVDKHRLDSIERRENRIFRPFWNAWYFFAYRPWLSWANPVWQSGTRIDQEKAQMRSCVENACVAISCADCGIIEGMPDWDNHSTLWLRMDVERAIDLYSCFGQLVNALQEALSNVQPSDLSSFIMSADMEYVAIVPLVRGRRLDDSVWRLHTWTAFIAKKSIEEHVLSYAPRPLPDSLLPSLHYLCWNFNYISLLSEFRSSIATLSLLAEHLADLVRLPEIEEEGERYCRGYLVRLGLRISEPFQKVLDTITEMAAFFNQLPEEEQAQRSSLCTAVGILIELASKIVPKENPDTPGQHPMSLGQMAEYSQRLIEARPLAEVARLYWIDDAIEHLEEETG